ncbi:MAG TPA: autotransporter-associated beta strand repeat-containing protein, partial [Tepidisphaeraceae bacterium]
MKPSPDSSAHRKQGATVRRAIVSAAAAVASTTLCSGTRAASPAWQGATSADWFDPANWSTAAVPTGGDSALLPAGIPVNQPDISAGAARASELTIDNTEGPYTVNGTGTLTLVGGGITVTGGGTAAINPLLLPLSPATWSVAVDTTLQVNGGLAGIQPISQTGPGTLELNYVPSNFAGGFAIVGALQAGARSGSPIAAFRSNTITLNGGTLSGGSSTATQLTAGTIIGTGAVQSSGKKLNLILTEDGSTAAAITAGAGSGGIQMQGLGTQTFTGAIDLTGGVSLAQSANLVFAGESVFFPKGIVAPTGPTPSSPGNTTAAVVKGGTLVLDNSAINNNDRVQGSGYIQVSGGGGVTLIGNAAGTSEDFGDMAIVAYSGAGNVRVVHNAAAAPTVLTLPGLGQANTTATLDFSANVPFATGNAPRIMLGAPTGYVFWTGFSSNRSTIVNNTLGVEGTNGFPNSTGMFTVNNRNDFAAYDPAAGIVPVTTGPFPTAPGGDAAANALLSASATTAGTGGGANFALNTLKIAPAADNQTLTIDGDGDLQISGYILAGPRTFTISSTGGGKIAGRHTRYFHVADPNGTLVLNADLAGLGPTGTPGVLQNNPITKDGPGTLVFAAPSTFGASINVNILDGALRGTLETNTAGQPSTLPFGQTTVRFRGGVLEIYGGGVFSRTLGSGGGRVTWGGAAVEAGSGGFAAMNGSARVDLGALDTRDDLRWRQSNFVFEDQALFFGSRDADSVIEWYDNINLNGATNDTFPSAREFRVFDNPNSIGDKAVITGEIKSNDASSGGLLADLLKTGDGTLVLAASSNGYLGNTIVAGGTLQATGSLASTNYILKAGSFLPDGGVPTTANFLLKGGSVTFSSARTVITSI